MSAQLIRGSGGGGKGGGGGSARAPVEAADSLRSRQYARVVDAISEGEIEGLVDGLKSVYLDDTPVQGSDGSMNFSGVSLATRLGTQAQSYIPGFPSVESEVPVSSEITAAAPVVRSISNDNANAVRVTVSVPRLTYQNPSNGDLTGTSVTIAIETQLDSAGWVPEKLRFLPYSLFVSGSSASSGTQSILSANISFSWTGTAPASSSSWFWRLGTLNPVQYCYWALEYRNLAGGAWTQFASGTLSGSARLETTWDNDYSTEINTWYPPTGAGSGSIELPEAAYEFRVVMTSGSGAVEISSATGYGYTNTDEINGKTTSRYQRSYRIERPGVGVLDIRVSRITADSISSNLSNAIWWDSYTEVIDAKLAYPNTAVVALSVDAEQFRTIPRRGYEIKGLKVRVPSNYDPITRAYTGAWDGTFSVAWSDSPAWCFYDLLTNDRYGLGAFIAADQVDKWTLYTIAQYCDEMVDDGFGGEEPRFTCNLYLQTREEAYKVINSFASIFRGMVYWAGGAITAVQDAPSDPVALFTPANVIDGQFNYSGSSVKSRHTVALVSWNDPADRYRQKIEYVEDTDGIAINGVIQTEVLAVGCASRGQAHRLGRWMLYTERTETEVVSFRTGLEGLSCRPGEIIQTTDPVRAGARMGGRVITATTSAVGIDASMTIESGKTYTLWAVLPDGSVESRAVTNAVGSTASLTVSPAFSAAPQDYSMWVLAASDVAPETWRVLSIVEVEGTQAEISALAYNGSKYAAVEEGLILQSMPISTLSDKPDAPSGLSISESLYLVSPVVVSTRITVSWQGSAQYYELQYRRAGTNWAMISTSSSSLDIQPAEPGDYEFSVAAKNALGIGSAAATATSVIVGPSGFVLADVQNLMTLYRDGRLVMYWDEVSDPRGIDYEVRFGPAWETAQVIGRTPLRQMDALGNGQYWVAAHYGASGSLNVYSAAPTGILIEGGTLTRNVIATYDEAALGWPGTLSGGAVIESGNIMLTGAGNILTAANILAELDILWYGGVAPAGQYDLPASHAVNIGRVAPCSVTMGYTVRGQSIYDNVLTLGDVLSVTDFLGAALGVKVGVQPQIALAQADGIYADWQNFVPGSYNAQHFKGRILISSSDPQVTSIVSGLTFMVDVPDRIVEGNVQIPAGGMSVIYSPAFNGGIDGNPVPLPQITVLNAQPGDDVILSAQTLSGFTVQVVNGGAGVIRNINHKEQGY